MSAPLWRHGHLVDVGVAWQPAGPDTWWEVKVTVDPGAGATYRFQLGGDVRGTATIHAESAEAFARLLPGQRLRLCRIATDAMREAAGELHRPWRAPVTDRRSEAP